MDELIIRWNIGESEAYKLNKAAFEMLYYSIGFSKLIFKSLNRPIEYYICYNNLRMKSELKLNKISKKYSIQSIDVSHLLPLRFKNSKLKNSWWKHSISRINRNSFEIIMDNDVILWVIPPTLKIALNQNALVALQDGVGKFYGDFLKSVEKVNSSLTLNAGLLGCPPGFEINLNEVPDQKYLDFFFSEQGYTALQYLNYKGTKLLIPSSEIQQLNANRIKADDLISNYYGGHFCGCSNGIETFWDDIYSKNVKKKYQEVLYEPYN